MRLYAVADEVRVRTSRGVRDWTKTGLVSVAQAQALRGDLATTLRRTGIMLRLGLAGFTVIAGAAAIGLVFLVTNMRSEIAVATTTAVLGAAALGAAILLARDFRLHRHGVEEALAMGAVGLFGFSAGLLGGEVFDDEGWALGLAAAAIAAAYVYRRFGFQYAAVVASYATALLPTTFDAVGLEFTRLFAALVCSVACGFWTGARGRADNDIARSDAEIIRAAAVVGIYLALNPYIVDEPLGRNAAGWYRWSSWALTWLLPFAIGRMAVAERDPLLLRVAMAAGLASLLTNKSYLGWPRQPWDPMLLGVVLVGIALGLRRWRSTGLAGERNGFTPRQLVESEGATVQLGSLASVAVQPTPRAVTGRFAEFVPGCAVLTPGVPQPSARRCRFLQERQFRRTRCRTRATPGERWRWPSG